jgi:hypothetical protein
MVHDSFNTFDRLCIDVRPCRIGFARWISWFAQPLQTTPAGALAGLRFAIKDNVDVLGLPTTAACAEFSHAPRQNAVLVQCPTISSEKN